MGNASYRILLAKLLHCEECIYGVKTTRNIHLAYKIGVYEIVTTTELAAMRKPAPKIVQVIAKNFV